MKSLAILIIFSILLLSAVAISSSKSENILPYQIHQYQMKNGLKVVTVPYDSPGIAAFYIVVRVGSRNEVEEGVTGFAHFFEHMMFRGTDKYPKEKYTEVLKSIGAAANANTSLDRTLYHMTGNADKLDLMFQLEADRFQNLNYSVEGFKVEAGAVKGEYTKNYASPYQQMFEKMRDTAFDIHTYKHTTMGFFDDIANMPNQYDYSLKFFKRYYRPEYCTIVVVGDVTPERVNKLSEKYFGEWQGGNYKSEVPVEPPQKEIRYVHLQNGTIPPYVALNYKGPAFNDREIDMPAIDVLNTILFSQNSELYTKLVVKEQKVRFLGGGASDTRDPYLITLQVSMVKKEDMQYVKDEFVRAIEEVKKSGVDENILSETKSHLKYQYAMGIDNPGAIANNLSHYIELTGDPESLNRLYAQYDKVTVDDIKYVVNKYYIPTGLTISTISEDEEGGVK